MNQILKAGQSVQTSSVPYSSQLAHLSEQLAGDTELRQCFRWVAAGRAVEVSQAWGAASTLMAATLARHLSQGWLLVVCPLPSMLDKWVDDLSLFTKSPVLPFPALEVRPNRILLDENYGDRIRVLKQLKQPSSHESEAIRSGQRDQPTGIVVTTVQSLLQGVPTFAALNDHSRRVAVGQTMDVDQFARWLVENRYHSTSAVELPGEFSVRGGIVDVFAVDWQCPVRLELFGDEIESIRQFEVSDQRSVKSLDSIELTALNRAEAYPLDDDSVEVSEGSQRDVSAQPPARGSLTDYLPDRSAVMVVDPKEVEYQGSQFLQRSEEAASYLTVQQLQDKLATFGSMSLVQLANEDDESVYRAPFESVERFSGEIGRVRNELDQAASGQSVFLVAETEAEIQRLSEILGTTQAAAESRLTYVLGRLSEGFRLTSSQTLVISGNELFHRAPLRRSAAKRRQGKAIESFLDLRDGDLIVHLAHGIGRYRGMKVLNKSGHVEEHLELEFHGGTRIYVPATKIELVQKYVGARRAVPRLAKIGGKAWAKQKAAAERAVEDLASDLLQVQAERQASPGIRFGTDTEWQQEFDAAFPYTETTDQLSAIDAIKSDMETTRPMDRLICGDVGFGKTELAMRAAFKAVDNGYQVAMLVPTTILAEQHFRTFTERMAEFPFTIAKLSRFCTAAEQRETIKALTGGGIDIVVGTHRLASRDVQFENLGLLIIDEEQRFGVKVKERLKSLRSTVDVLTLSATPIPRTLHMSLTGIRDISNLETPPEDRVAVETRVTRWNGDLIRRALMRELNRGGQAYFVHNRVSDIENIAAKVQHLVPEATIAVGHGQMPEGELEKVMVGFVDGKFDILLATTIVESGLDIPNANTIFIDDAHRYGLADLHQLRGRVGRYKHRAYCYLLVNPERSLTASAARRLRAIEEFSDMGAGFSIAMRDLEIRGAGNVLGTQQSGHIAMVGYELYCQLLDAAVRRMKRLPPRITNQVDIELPGEAFIPRTYVPDMRSKIDLYRRLARAASDEAIEQIRSELIDRFGTLPPEVDRLVALAKLRNEAAFWQMDSIHTEDQYLVFGYRDEGRARQLVKRSAERLRIVDDQSIYLTLSKNLSEPDAIINVARQCLQT